MIFKKIFFIVICFLSYLYIFAFSSEKNKREIIRVLIFSSQNRVYFNGIFEFYVGNKRVKILKNDWINIKITFKKYKNSKIKRNLYFKNLTNGFFKLGKNKYAGNLKVLITNNQIYYINYIKVEKYIKGVLPYEISSKWPMEVIKAQAVAARTFAYYAIVHNAKNFYDLTDTTYSQVYKGIIPTAKIFTKAIEETKDEVLVYKHELIQAFFHSVCGGHTESAKNVWGKNLPYLKGVPCGYCRDAPYYRWKCEFTEKEILNKLRKHKIFLRKIKYIKPAYVSSSGRWNKIKIVGDKSIILTGNRFRIILGIKKLRSTKIRIRKIRNKFVIYGHGWGHGVGLCQWGAKRMAEKGKKYYQILRYYYRGVCLRKISSLF